MFEEPIKIGLIRFADLYDHKKIRVPKKQHKDVGLKRSLYRNRQAQIEKENESDTRTGTGSGTRTDQDIKEEQRKREREREQQDFDLSHQPILVIYTSVSPSEN